MSAVPYPSLQIRFVAQGEAREVFALVDTGFDGDLVIPESLIGELPNPTYVDRARVASGDFVVVAAYAGTVELVDQPGPISAHIIALGDEYLIGITVLNNFRVIFDHGQRVMVEP